MYKITDGKIYRGSDLIDQNVLVTQLNNIEKMMTKHKLPELGSKMRLLSDWLDMKDSAMYNMTNDVLYGDGLQDDLHTIANFLSALQREVLI